MASERFSFLGEAEDAGHNLKLLRAIFWLITSGAGFLQAWATRFRISPDGNGFYAHPLPPKPE